MAGLKATSSRCEPIRRLLEIGEAAKAIGPELTATNPDIVQLTVDNRLAPLAAAIERLLQRMYDGNAGDQH